MCGCGTGSGTLPWSEMLIFVLIDVFLPVVADINVPAVHEKSFGSQDVL
jgi:hypothetical protein